MSRVKQRYKLPRNWIAIPLFLYTIIFIISIGVISISFETFSEYSSTLKARAETEKVSHYAELYDTAQEGSSDQLLSYFKEQGYDCIVFNNNKLFSAQILNRQLFWTNTRPVMLTRHHP